MTARDLLAAALTPFKNPTADERAPAEMAANILAASPALAQAIELGLAWQRAEAALPEGYRVWETDFGVRYDLATPSGGRRVGGFRVKGPTPTAALNALADALEKRE